MANASCEFRLPTLDSLQGSVPAVVDAEATSVTWLKTFAKKVSATDIDGLLNLFIPRALWRDLLALTWDFRCFDGHAELRQFLKDRLCAGLDNIGMSERDISMLQQPFPDLAWIIFTFTFQTKVGNGSGVVRLVPTSTGEWKAATILTNLESLKGHPEKIGPLRSNKHTLGNDWKDKENALVTAAPQVLVIGAGHAGLSIAARLKCLGVPTLVVEAQPRIGDKWRNRYDSLCLHWPIWYDHLPYLPFPPTWPKYSPAPKLADWLEYYANALEINVWTSSAVISAIPEEEGGKWVVEIQRATSRDVLKVDHVVFATGFGDYDPYTPNIPGKSNYRGQVLHSTEYKNAEHFVGKKVVVVGSGNSGHDVSADLARHGIDVTMFQKDSTFVMDLDKNWMKVGGLLYSETSPPIEVADRLFASMPHAYSVGGLTQRGTKAIEATDKQLLDGLRDVGFKLSHGIHNTGIFLLLKQKGGGHYFDIGASKLIIDGKIKLKNDSQIKSYTTSGLAFDNGSEFEADAIIFATGMGPLNRAILSLCGQKVVNKMKPILGLDKDGELRGIYRDLGVKGLWYTTGNLQMSRFFSQHLALQIKAMQVDLLDSRYSL